jgi:hypothetical protein
VWAPTTASRKSSGFGRERKRPQPAKSTGPVRLTIDRPPLLGAHRSKLQQPRVIGAGMRHITRQRRCRPDSVDQPVDYRCRNAFRLHKLAQHRRFQHVPRLPVMTAYRLGSCLAVVLTSVCRQRGANDKRAEARALNPRPHRGTPCRVTVFGPNASPPGRCAPGRARPKTRRAPSPDSSGLTARPPPLTRTASADQRTQSRFQNGEPP